MTGGWSVWRQHKAGAGWVEMASGYTKAEADRLAGRLTFKGREDGSGMRATTLRTGEPFTEPESEGA